MRIVRRLCSGIQSIGRLVDSMRWALPLLLGLSWGLAAGQCWTRGTRFWASELPLSASGTAVVERFAVATGPVDDQVEGLFILDSLTGELQCLVMNVRNAKFGGKFRTNVMQDLGIVPRQDAQFALVTGQADFARAGRVSRVGSSVAYVVDPTTGTYAAYALRWRPEVAAAGREQAGTLEVLDRGQLTAPVAPAAVQLSR
jgi:hypothetical protein